MSTKIKTDVEFGKVYRDINSGFEGVAVCISKWQFGCIRVNLQPKADKDGKLPEIQAFDEGSLESVVPVKKTHGGPAPLATRNPDPVR